MYLNICDHFTVEKVTVLCRLLDTDTIQHNQIIQTALAHAFALLTGSLVDINAAVAQRAIQYLGTIKDSAIKVIMNECYMYFKNRFLLIIDLPIDAGGYEQFNI